MGKVLCHTLQMFSHTLQISSQDILISNADSAHIYILMTNIYLVFKTLVSHLDNLGSVDAGIRMVWVLDGCNYPK